MGNFDGTPLTPPTLDDINSSSQGPRRPGFAARVALASPSECRHRKRAAPRHPAQSVSVGSKRCVRKLSDLSRDRDSCDPSALASGHAIIARHAKSLIYASSARKKPRLLVRNLPGMPLSRITTRLLSSGDSIVTWHWSRERPGEPRGQKRALPESIDGSTLSQDSTQGETEDGLKMWGYMPGHVHYNLSCANGEVRGLVPRVNLAHGWQDSPKKESSSEPDLSDEVAKVLPVVPPRSITGMGDSLSWIRFLTMHRRFRQPLSQRRELPI